MSAAETIISEAGALVHPAGRESFFSRTLKALCSVQLGIVLLILLISVCMIGMLVMQQNVAGFDRYYTELTPAQLKIYSWLGLFDVYHSWYFNLLLALLSLNIVLASLDRFPATWQFVSKPTVAVPTRWLLEQQNAAKLQLSQTPDDAVGQVMNAMRFAGWKRIRSASRNGAVFIFAESGVWNRFAYLFVHFGLLTIFLGGFLTAQLGSTGLMRLAPGQSSSVLTEPVVHLDQKRELTRILPFEITFMDVEQRLVRRDGPITAANTVDWVTRFQIKDELGTHEALVQLNRPFDHRGYRFFHSESSLLGRARTILLRITPDNSGVPFEVSVPRDGSFSLPDGRGVRFSEFRADFSLGNEDRTTDTTSYANPGAVLKISEPEGSTVTAYAFTRRPGDTSAAKRPESGYTFEIVDLERAADTHTLIIQRDPGIDFVYAGFVILLVSLAAVFAFSHQRVWAAIAPAGHGPNSNVTLGGQTNRNNGSLERKFQTLLDELASEPGT